MGCGPIPKMIEELKAEIKVKWHLTVICGTNKKLFDKVEKLFGEDENISVLGFVKDIPLLMDSADLYITKPGGLSVTESNAKNLPMAFINVVAACEDDNRLLFLKHGCAIEGDDPKELARHCAKVLSNDELLAELKRNITEMEKLNTSEIIFETMKGLVEEDDFASV
jgi:processive 1,2-diacylglycerol beta-glucosyltransferase